MDVNFYYADIVMNKETARRICQVIRDFNINIERTIGLVKRTASKDEYHEYIRKVGAVYKEVYNMLEPVYDNYPELLDSPVMPLVTLTNEDFYIMRGGSKHNTININNWLSFLVEDMVLSSKSDETPKAIHLYNILSNKYDGIDLCYSICQFALDISMLDCSKIAEELMLVT